MLVYCALVLYLVWFVATYRVKEQTTPFGPDWLVSILHWVFRSSARMLGVEQSSILEEPLDPKKQYMITCTPHGAYAVSGLLFIAPQWRVDPAYKGHRLTSIGASVLFLLPIVREIILLLGGREVTKTNLERLISAGNSIGMIPGGIWEQVNTDHTQEKTYVHKNLGFLRLAIKSRLHVIPMYGFGENQLFSCHPHLTKLRQWLARRWVGLPLITGKWGTPLPHATHVTHVYGPSIDTGAVSDRITRAFLARPSASHTSSELGSPELEKEILEAVFAEYRMSMHSLFDRHKCLLPPAVAAKGLVFVRLGHDNDPALDDGVVSKTNTNGKGKAD